MRALIGLAGLCLVLAACGPDSYEQAKRTQMLAKCGDAATFDQQCSDAYDVIAGPGQGAKQKQQLEMNSYQHNMRDWGRPELRVVPGGSLGASPAYEKARVKASLPKCSQGATFDQECSDAFDAIFKPGAGAQQRTLLLQKTSTKN